MSGMLAVLSSAITVQKRGFEMIPFAANLTQSSRSELSGQQVRVHLFSSQMLLGLKTRR